MDNETKGKIIRRMKCVILIVLTLTLFGYGLYKVSNYERLVQMENWRDDLWELVNDYRTEKGLPPFVEDTKLCRLAIIRSYEAQELWGHYGPNGILESRTMANYCSDCKSMGENLAKDFSTTQGVINGWIKSPAHESVLLMDAQLACIGVSEDEEGNNYVSLIIGKMGGGN